MPRGIMYVLGRHTSSLVNYISDPARHSAGFFAAAAVMALVVLLISYAGDYKFRHLSTQEHLQQAEAACAFVTKDQDCQKPDEAKRHLAALSKDAPEFAAASALLGKIQEQEENKSKQNEEEPAQSGSRAYDRMRANYDGRSNDPYTCAMSTENKPITSFNEGANWWKDDGRCDKRLQKTRDEDASTSSYFSTTIRVDTDMDSFWLPDEERICQTYPDEKGSVSVVGCNQSDTHHEHNIPVRFWGGVNRNTVSSWKCRREKSFLDDQFVCRATD